MYQSKIKQEIRRTVGRAPRPASLAPPPFLSNPPPIHLHNNLVSEIRHPDSHVFCCPLRDSALVVGVSIPICMGGAAMCLRRAGVGATVAFAMEGTTRGGGAATTSTAAGGIFRRPVVRHGPGDPPTHVDGCSATDAGVLERGAMGRTSPPDARRSPPSTAAAHAATTPAADDGPRAVRRVAARWRRTSPAPAAVTGVAIAARGRAACTGGV